MDLEDLKAEWDKRDASLRQSLQAQNRLSRCLQAVSTWFFHLLAPRDGVYSNELDHFPSRRPSSRSAFLQEIGRHDWPGWDTRLL